MPGSRISSTRQLETAGRVTLRNSSVDPKTSACSPTDFSRLLTASRMDASSSTTKTAALESSPAILGASWHRELKNRAARRTRHSPQSSSVRFDNRAANRQPHADALSLSCKKRIEHLFHDFGT